MAGIERYRETIFQLRQQGQTMRDIGKEIAYSKSSVARFLKEADDPLGGKRGQSQKIRTKYQRVHELMDQGLNDTQIAIKMQLEGDGYTPSRITQLRHARKG